MTADSKPELLIFEHGDTLGLSSQRLLESGQIALPLCLAHPAQHEVCLPNLSEIEVNLVMDDKIAQLHDEFMGDPAPTDVITFHHGEIFISLETAEREGVKFGHSIEKEALLYLIHGMLHLNGHDDKTPDEREVMKSLQEQILAEVWEQSRG
ncbi:MAG: rRNA maturation RNase YbeY [Verrucomicrobia bacterium]|nr:rRNA maturation RNase YbeY [Verrucomicrobiota bacterium]